MFQPQPPQQRNNLYIVYWATALEPVILAGIAYVLKAQGAVGNIGNPFPEESVMIVFLALSLILGWLSLRFSSGKSIMPPSLSLRQTPNPAGYRIIALALAITPGMLGFIHYIIFGNSLALLVLNGGALALAIKHIMKFNENN